MSRLVPSDDTRLTILAVAHSHTARSTTTESTPMIIPSDESHARILLASILRDASLRVL